MNTICDIYNENIQPFCNNKEQSREELSLASINNNLAKENSEKAEKNLKTIKECNELLQECTKFLDETREFIEHETKENKALIECNDQIRVIQENMNKLLLKLGLESKITQIAINNTSDLADAINMIKDIRKNLIQGIQSEMIKLNELMSNLKTCTQNAVIAINNINNNQLP